MTSPTVPQLLSTEYVVQHQREVADDRRHLGGGDIHSTRRTRRYHLRPQRNRDRVS